MKKTETLKEVPHFSSQHFQLVLFCFHTALMPKSPHNQNLQKMKSKQLLVTGTSTEIYFHYYFIAVAS